MHETARRIVLIAATVMLAPAGPFAVTMTAIKVLAALEQPLCVAVDPRDPTGVWWWEPGSSGCSSRSTGPGVFHAERATVALSAGGRAIDIGFQLQLHRAPGSGLPEFVDVSLVLDGDEIRCPASGARTRVERRTGLDVPEKVR